MFALFSFVGCNRNEPEIQSESAEEQTHDDSALDITTEALEQMGLEFISVGVQSISKTVTATGRVSANANKVAIVGPIVSGRVSKIHVNQGAFVKKGDLLVELESVELGQAKSEFFSARTQFELDSANYMRQKNLFDKNIGSRKDLLSTEAEFKKSRSDFFTTERKLHLMGLTEEDVQNLSGKNHELSPVVRLVSPIDGIVVERNGTLGEKVDQESNLFRIVDITTLWIDVDIYENDLPQIAIGQKVEVRVTSYPEEVFFGEVHYISSEFHKTTRTAVVRTEVENKVNGRRAERMVQNRRTDGRGRGQERRRRQGVENQKLENMLKIGMFANITIYTEEDQVSIVVPADAVIDHENKKIVIVKDKDGFERRDVSVGQPYNGQFAILSGLEEGEEIVVRGNFQLFSEMIKGKATDVHVH